MSKLRTRALPCIALLVAVAALSEAAERSTFRMPDNSWWNRRDWYNSGLRIVIPLLTDGTFAAPEPKEEKK
jgi:hypothetical protein